MPKNAVKLDIKQSSASSSSSAEATSFSSDGDINIGTGADRQSSDDSLLTVKMKKKKIVEKRDEEEKQDLNYFAEHLKVDEFKADLLADRLKQLQAKYEKDDKQPMSARQTRIRLQKIKKFCETIHAKRSIIAFNHPEKQESKAAQAINVSLHRGSMASALVHGSSSKGCNLMSTARRLNKHKSKMSSGQRATSIGKKRSSLVLPGGAE